MSDKRKETIATKLLTAGTDEPMEIIEPAQEESVPTSTSISISVGSSSAAHARNEIRVRICLFTKLLPEPNQLKAARVAIERMLVLQLDM